MIFKSSSVSDVKKAKEVFKKLLNTDCTFELKKILQTRTSKQNKALHLYFKFIANELNNLGLTFKYEGLNIKGLESRYTEFIVKEFIWRPIQISMFEIKSTSKINTTQINEIVDVITLFFAERGINLQFPEIEQLKNE